MQLQIKFDIKKNLNYWNFKEKINNNNYTFLHQFSKKSNSNFESLWTDIQKTKEF